MFKGVTMKHTTHDQQTVAVSDDVFYSGVKPFRSLAEQMGLDMVAFDMRILDKKLKVAKLVSDIHKTTGCGISTFYEAGRN